MTDEEEQRWKNKMEFIVEHEAIITSNLETMTINVNKLAELAEDTARLAIATSRLLAKHLDDHGQSL